MKLIPSNISYLQSIIYVILFLVIAKRKFQNAAAAAATNETTTTPTLGATPAFRLPPPPKVKVNKCCHFAEHLDVATQSCVPGNSPHWVPLVFLINKRQYFGSRGESPKFITFEENARPVWPEDAAEKDPTKGCSAANLEHFTGADNIVLFSNGSLYLRERSQFIEPRHYCIDREAALVCFPQVLEDNKQQRRLEEVLPQLKLKKCCSRHGSYNTTAKTCHFDAANQIQQLLPINQTIFQTIYGFPTCTNASLSLAIAGDFEESNLDNKTGELVLQHKKFSLAEYCLEHIRMDQMLGNGSTARRSAVKVFTCLHHFENKDAGAVSSDADLGTATVSDIDTAAAAADEANSTSEQLQVAVLNIGIMISVIFLAATLVAGYLLPSVHHVLHWRCQIYYVFCLFIGDLLLAYTQLTSHLELGSVACTMIASIMHFFFLAAFFWLNTMCFNIWWTFRDFRPSSLERNQEIFRLRLYSAYAWGIPLLIATIAVTIDQLPDTDLLKPGFGVRSCWFSGGNIEIFAYFFGPVGILLCANMALFISTTHQLTCGLWKRDDVKSTTEKTALGKVCLKLVIVMGVTWIADVISWHVGGPHAAWFFTDLINALQGVFIFLVVGCQPQVWTAIKRLCCPSTRQEITNTTNGVHHSSSSHGLPSLTACNETTQNTSLNTTLGAAGGTTANQAKFPMETVC